MARVLITGFGPFPGVPRNPTALLVARLAGNRRGTRRHALATHVFPTSYAAIDRELPALLAKHRPQVLVLFGVATRTPWLRVETLAHNHRSPLLPDVDGVVPASATITPHAPPALRGRAPFIRLVAAARAAGVAVRLSRDAGTYLCNYAYWRALESAGRPGGPRLVVFIHVPKLRSGLAVSGHRRLPTLDQLVHAAESILAAAISAAALG